MARQPLGKGLGAILGGGASKLQSVDAAGAGAGAAADTSGRGTVGQDTGAQGAGGERLDAKSSTALMVPIERIVSGRGQPRRKFDDRALDELAASIREQGIIQPLVVVPRDGGYELVAGERRLRASVRAGLERVPVVVRAETGEPELLELALVENLQREDLGPLERARAYDRLTETHGYSQEDVAKRVGKSRAAVANAIRLLGLPQPVLEVLEQGLITEGHGRALLGAGTMALQIELLRVVVRKGLSVRETEDFVKTRNEASGTHKSRTSLKRAPTALEQQLGRRLSTKVRLRGTEKKGKLEIEFYSRDELTRLIDILTR